MAFLKYTVSPSSRKAEETYSIGPLIEISFIKWAQVSSSFTLCHARNNNMHHLCCLCAWQPVHLSWARWVQLTATNLISLILISFYHPSWQGQKFSSSSKRPYRLWNPSILQYNEHRQHSPEVKRPERESNTSTPSSAVKNLWTRNSCSMPSWQAHDQLCIFSPKIRSPKNPLRFFGWKFG